MGSEQTSKLRKENIVNRDASELIDERVSLKPPLTTRLQYPSHNYQQEHFDAGPLDDADYPISGPERMLDPALEDSWKAHTRNFKASHY